MKKGFATNLSSLWSPPGAAKWRYPPTGEQPDAEKHVRAQANIARHVLVDTLFSKVEPGRNYDAAQTISGEYSGGCICFVDMNSSSLSTSSAIEPVRSVAKASQYPLKKARKPPYPFELSSSGHIYAMRPVSIE